MESIKEYQIEAEETMNMALSDFDMLECAVYGIMGEVGKLATLLNSQRFKESGESIENNRAMIKDALGDILWYTAEAATAVDEALADIADENLEKIRRKYPYGR